MSPGIDVAASGAAIVRPKSIKSARLITSGEKNRKRDKEMEAEQEIQIESKKYGKGDGARDFMVDVLAFSRGFNRISWTSSVHGFGTSITTQETIFTLMFCYCIYIYS